MYRNVMAIAISVASTAHTMAISDRPYFYNRMRNENIHPSEITITAHQLYAIPHHIRECCYQRLRVMQEDALGEAAQWLPEAVKGCWALDQQLAVSTSEEGSPFFRCVCVELPLRISPCRRFSREAP